MDELIKGLESGVLALVGAVPMVASALVGYGTFNSYRRKKLVIIIGFVLLLFFSYSVGFGTSVIDYCDKTGCHYEELPIPPLGWSAVTSTLITTLSGFGLGIFLAYHFPWQKKQEEKMFTSKEVAEILQIPEKTIIYWVESKFMFGIVHSNGANIPQQSLIKWLKKFSKINSLAHNDKNMHWINKTMIEKVHLIRSRKGAVA